MTIQQAIDIPVDGRVVFDLPGGDKITQQADIEKAQKLAKEV